MLTALDPYSGYLNEKSFESMKEDTRGSFAGIGIHIGYATAGTIGSQNRFEYTFIGDTVNIASRLDGLSKRLGYSIIISEDTYNELNRLTQTKFTDLGEQKIRGKETPIHVYGASTMQYIEH